MDNVLIFDSDRKEIIAIKNFLRSSIEGIDEILEAQSKESVVETLQKKRVDIFVMSMLNSPRSVASMVELAKKSNRDIKIILTSSGTEMDAIRLTSKLKIDEYLLKPVSPDRLTACVNSLINRESYGLAKEDEEQIKRYKKIIIGIKEELMNLDYKLTVKYAKEYIDDVFESLPKKSTVLGEVARLSGDIAHISNEISSFDKDTNARIQDKVKSIKGNADISYNRVISYNEITTLIDIIFEYLEKRFLPESDFRKVLNYINRNVAKGMTLEEVARFASMSTANFSKVFKKATGMNFIDYITDARIERAKELLQHTEMPILVISSELSYNDTNYFSKAFKKKTDYTPTKYREIFRVK